ncbi:MAG TPA: CPBP family intramembrane glutamic endopeptidase [Flavisolibacter sp.]|nr:CPBP family intramembrane glutamic endopeptidase [Flavisolibacter sp.]
MKRILFYIKEYARETNKTVFTASTIFVAFAIFINYHFGLNSAINALSEPRQYLGWLIVFLTAFLFAYVVQALFFQTTVFQNKKALTLLFIGPAIFAWKMSYNLHFDLTDDAAQNAYWNHVVYWPLKLAIVTGALYLVWLFYDRKEQPFYGTDTKDFKAGPYFIMLLIMVPLIAAASTQPDFLAMYPKLKNVQHLASQNSNGIYKLLYELSYGSDFFSIELFFRGFLVLAFAKWVGKDAILPMAIFYCTIHFGKPLGECISSFFGGLLLGIVTYNTRNIFGGLIVHLGIAWLMELGGYLGNWYK